MSLSQVTIAPGLPVWAILSLAVLGVLAVVVQFLVLRKKLRDRRSVLLSALRGLVLLLLIAITLNPFLAERKDQSLRPGVAVLLDTSESMNLRGKGGGSRLDEARSLLQDGSNPLLRTLEEKYDLQIYGLGETLRQVKNDDLGSLKGESKEGDLTEALKHLRQRNAAVLLLSDGNLKWEEGPSQPLPAVAIPLGDRDSYKDILIKSVKFPGLAFRSRKAQIDVTLKGYGYRGLTVPVFLKEGSKLITAKSAQLAGDGDEVVVSLSFTPEEAGQRSLSISIPLQAGESLTSNNAAAVTLKVLRDKIRVLMVSGSPSLNYRFMRTALKNDPSVDLLSFVILRTPSNIMNVPQHEQSLIPFPVETIFSKEIKTFDLVIFDNFSPHPYLKPSHLQSLREYVKDGGSFALIGGPNLADGNDDASSPLQEMLPVRFSGKEAYRRDGPSGVKLSRAGVTHPITRLLAEEAGNRQLWRDMPTLEGFNPVESKATGLVLLENSDGTAQPVLTVGSYGKGRVLALVSDASWKWYMGMVGQGKSHWAYLRFIEKMVRWLTKDPSLDPVQMTFREGIHAAGEPIEFRFNVREEIPSPGGKTWASLSVFDAQGRKITSGMRPAGSPGEYVGSFLPEKEGTFKVKVEASAGALEEALVVAVRSQSLDAAPDHERLKRISTSTGGKVMSKGDDVLKEIDGYATRGRKGFVEERQRPLWATPYVMLGIVGLLAVEWYLRRRWGLA